MTDTKQTSNRFKLFPSQSKVLRSKSEITLLVAGRGIGKSTVACHWVLGKIINEPEVIGFIGTPSHAQTNDLMTKLVNLLADIGIPYIIGKKPPTSWGSTLVDHKYYLSVMIPGRDKCSHVRFGTLENYESHRGISIGWMVIDEAALIREVAYREVLLPALRGYGQEHIYSQLLLTTPKGISNWVSDLTENKKVEVIRAPSAENFIEFPQEKLDYIRDLMSDRQYRQEILGEIINVSSRSQFHAFTNDMIRDEDIEGRWKWGLCSDQNIDPLTLSVVKFSKDKVVIWDEIYIEGGATVKDLVQEIVKKDYLKGGPLELFGDRSGNNRSLTSDESFYQQLISRCREKGFRLIDRTLNKNPPIYESRELVCAWMEKGKLFVRPNLKHIVTDFERCQYTEDFKTNKKVYDGHLADGFAYFMWKEFHQSGNKVLGSISF